MPTLVQPFPMRSNICEETGGLRISIPMKRNWFILAFFTLWLCGWSYGGLQVLRHLLRDFELFSALWMVGWALGEVWVVTAYLRMVGGRDVLVLRSDTVELRKETFCVGAS